MLHVYYRWGMVSFLLIRCVFVCVCFLFLCQWVLACICWKYSVFRNGVGKDRTQMFLCQCLTYVHFQFYLQRLFPSKLHAKGQVKRWVAQFLYSCLLWIFYLFVLYMSFSYRLWMLVEENVMKQTRELVFTCFLWFSPTNDFSLEEFSNCLVLVSNMSIDMYN